MKEKIDLNADIGESFGTYKLGEDENIVSFISSANIATGFHAGDPNWMKITIDLSLSNNVKIGAHPSYPDLHGFGRRNMDLNSLEIENIIKYQVGSMIGFTGLENLQHVKPHGALYNKAVNDPIVANSIINAIKSISSEIIHVVLAGSLWEDLADESNVKYVREAYADREIMSDGSLCPRNIKGSVITDPNLIAKRSLDIVLNKKVQSFEGDYVSVDADSICLHGDTKGAVKIANVVFNNLKENDIDIVPMCEIL